MKKINLKEIKELFILILIAFTIKTCLIEIYIVPTGSMERTILVGDMLFGNKFVYGMKTPTWIGIPYTRIGFDIPYYRFPNFKEVENDDVVIFEFPRDPFQKYVKRCIGVPGDKIKIDEGNVYVNDIYKKLPIEGQFIKKDKLKSDFRFNKNVSSFDINLLINKIIIPGTNNFKKETDYTDIYSLFDNEPFYDSNNNLLFDSSFENYIDINKNDKWDYGNIDNINEFIVPQKGDEFVFKNVLDWHHMINLLILDGNSVVLDGWSLTVIDPQEIARLSGIVKYKILSLISPKGTDLNRRRYLEHKEYEKQLVDANTEESIITPWDNRIKSKITDNEYVYNNLFINGKKANETNVYVLQKDYYFMVGDNRDNSSDSRFWGFVPDNLILGTPIYAFINLSGSKLKSFFRMKVVN